MGERFYGAVLRFAAGIVLVAVLALSAYEVHTSAFQAQFWSSLAARLSFDLGVGASPRIAFPHPGPFDARRGYAHLPAFQRRLEAEGFQIARQARMSEPLNDLVSWGIPPPYREPAAAGFVLTGADGSILYDGTKAERLFERFEDIPPLLIHTLLFMEDRELLAPTDARHNPVIEWDRLAKAGVMYAGRKVGLEVPLEGGSTLATQLEKYRHSPGGRTGGGIDKLKQIAAASLKVYRDGPDTRLRRHEILVDYLNTLPLAGAPGYGEVYGLGNGLYAWFGLELADVAAALTPTETTPTKVRAYKHVLALLGSLRSPSTYLATSRERLEQRVGDSITLLVRAGVIDAGFAEALRATPIVFLDRSPAPPPFSFVEQKATNAIRTGVMQALNLPSLYDLDRVDLRAHGTIDPFLQRQIAELLRNLTDPEFAAAKHLFAERLLRGSDPTQVIYSLLLFESTPEGNLLRVHADNLDRWFDINDGVKLELGSTAKLRTLAHYLELIAALHHELAPLEPAALAARAEAARDPLTEWAAKTLQATPGLDLPGLLDRALERKYSASPWEQFFTGSGVHMFENFDREDNRRIYTVRRGLAKSINLVFIRLMRDLVRFHQARLPYDAKAIIEDQQHPERQALLIAIADDAGRQHLARAFRAYRQSPPDAIVDRLLGKRADSLRHNAIVFLAWHPQASADELAVFLRGRLGKVTGDEVAKLMKSYAKPHFTIGDWGYLLSRDPLEVWTAGELAREPELSWQALLERSAEARQFAYQWLFKTRNRRAQNVRLRIHIERDAFARMTPYWQRLGFPFSRLVPSLATAIGNSSDRPSALAELMGIIVNDGVRVPMRRVTELHFAQGTPYETVFTPVPHLGERVMEPEVAQALQQALAGVVTGGTAGRVAGAFLGADGKPLTVGGKTGSGDNRFQTFNRWGGVTSSRAVNRTATFVFYIGDRHFGVVTAIVPGEEAAKYEFTSALALTVLKLAAPAINLRLREPPPQPWHHDAPRVQTTDAAPPAAERGA